MQAIFFALLMAVAPDGVNPAAAPQLSAQDQSLLDKCTKTGTADTEAACTSLIEQSDLDGQVRAYAYVGRANMRMAQTDKGPALDDLNHSIAIYGGNPLAYVLRAALYRDGGKYDLALADASKALEILPKLGGGYLLKSNAEFGLGRMDAALADANQAVALLPENPDAWLARGGVYTQLRQWDLAIADLTKALTFKVPRDILPALHNRGTAFRGKGAYANALADATEEIALAPRNADGYLSRAEAYLTHDLFDLAIADLDQTLAISPDDSLALRLRSFAYLSHNQPAQALADAQTLVAHLPGAAQAYLARGDAYYAQHDDDNALDDYAKSLSLQDGWEAHNHRANLYVRMGRGADAMADIEKALALSPQSTESFLLRGFIKEKAGDHDGAAADYRAALKFPGPPSTQAGAQAGLKRLGAAP